MALTIVIVNAEQNPAAPAGAAIVNRSFAATDAGVTTRSPKQTFELDSSLIRNAVELTGYSNFTTEITTAATAYINTFYDATETITLDVVIKTITISHSSDTEDNLWQTGTDQHTTVVTIYEQHG